MAVSFVFTGVTPATRDRPILKPWKMATNSELLRQHLDRQCIAFRRDGRHEDGRVHAICQGADTKATQSHPIEIVKAIHTAHTLDVAERIHTFAYYS